MLQNSGMLAEYGKRIDHLIIVVHLTAVLQFCLIAPVYLRETVDTVVSRVDLLIRKNKLIIAVSQRSCHNTQFSFQRQKDFAN